VAIFATSVVLTRSNAKLRILGIDPGSIVTGYGIIDSDGAHSIHVASGPLRVKADSLPERLKLIFEGITRVIQEYRPQAVAIEKVFMNRNADSALKLGQARGAAIAAAVMQDMPVSEYTPRHIKQAVVGKGSAAKEQVQHMVKILLNHPGELQSDEADALAVALTHGHIGGTLERMAEHSRPTAYKRKRR
jgi:crossover junction endodeoxyribonuclease RuvC